MHIMVILRFYHILPECFDENRHQPAAESQEKSLSLMAASFFLRHFSKSRSAWDLVKWPPKTSSLMFKSPLPSASIYLNLGKKRGGLSPATRLVWRPPFFRVRIISDSSASCTKRTSIFWRPKLQSPLAAVQDFNLTLADGNGIAAEEGSQDF